MPASQNIEQCAAIDDTFTGEELANWRQEGF
jgi:hypothetical protein